MRKFPTLTADHKKARIDFAHTYVSRRSKWVESILNDEEKSSLNGPDRFTSYWRDLRNEAFLREISEFYAMDCIFYH
uniref:COesterase domain-containing protein n=1 Tax=Heterorhabditis bacteriophora TaxID=37862 RepID=A0A1I7XHM0_HETBA